MQVELRCYSNNGTLLNTKWVEIDYLEDLIKLFPEVDFTDKDDRSSIWIEDTNQAAEFGINYEDFKLNNYEILPHIPNFFEN